VWTARSALNVLRQASERAARERFHQRPRHRCAIGLVGHARIVL
jgi:hypothetical protein